MWDTTGCLVQFAGHRFYRKLDYFAGHVRDSAAFLPFSFARSVSGFIESMGNSEDSDGVKNRNLTDKTANH